MARKGFAAQFRLLSGILGAIGGLTQASPAAGDAFGKFVDSLPDGKGGKLAPAQPTSTSDKGETDKDGMSFATGGGLAHQSANGNAIGINSLSMAAVVVDRAAAKAGEAADRVEAVGREQVDSLVRYGRQFDERQAAYIDDLAKLFGGRQDALYDFFHLVDQKQQALADGNVAAAHNIERLIQSLQQNMVLWFGELGRIFPLMADLLRNARAAGAGGATVPTPGSWVSPRPAAPKPATSRLTAPSLKSLVSRGIV